MLFGSAGEKVGIVLAGGGGRATVGAESRLMAAEPAVGVGTASYLTFIETATCSRLPVAFCAEMIGTASISAAATKDIIYAGKVDHGFDKTSAAALRKKLTP